MVGLEGATLAIVDADRNWKSSVTVGQAGNGAPVRASNAPIRWL